jgi:predicted PurR-regulated permease PerM
MSSARSTVGLEPRGDESRSSDRSSGAAEIEDSEESRSLGAREGAALGQPDGSAEARHAWTARDRRKYRDRGVKSIAFVGIFILGILYTLYFARDFLLPVVLAFFLKLLLAPLVRRLLRLGIPEALGAAAVLLLVLSAGFWTAWTLSGPANEWVERAPRVLRDVDVQLRGVRKSVESVSRAAEEVEKITDVDGDRTPAVQLQGAKLTDLLFHGTRSLIATGVATVVLLYLLLASGDLFLRKAITILPRLDDKVRAVDVSKELEVGMSRYLVTICLVNAGLGIVMALVTYLFGMPNPILWGMMVALFNFVPYLGAIASLTILTLAAFVTFDDVERALLIGGLFFLVDSTEAYFVTPTFLGRRMRLNPVVIFVAIIFFGWAWGIYGLILAVPVLTTFKLVCDHIDTLGWVSEILSG